MTTPDKDIKLINHNAGQVNEPDDPSFPFKLEVSFRPPEFMTVAFIGMHGGTEEIVARGMNKEVLQHAVRENGFRTHPRLIRLTLTGPDGIVDQHPAPKDGG